MGFSKTVYYLLLCAVHTWYASSDECGAFTHMVKHDGKRLQDHVFEVIHGTTSLTRCWGLCTRRYDCKSLNYAESLEVCEMNSELVSSKDDLSNNTRYVYTTTTDTGSCQVSPGDDAIQPECCFGEAGSYNLQQRSCPGSSSNWCTCLNGFTGPMCTLSKSFSGIASNCKKYQEAGHATSGVLQIDPTGNAPFEAVCDMKTASGGWTLIQRRSDGSLLFNKTWDEYVSGFGTVSDEFWIGLENIYQLTGGVAEGKLYVQLTDDSNNQFYALYNFGIVENSRFTARFTYIEGNAGDSLSNHDNVEFSTRDRNNVIACVDDAMYDNEWSSTGNYLSENATKEPEEIEEISCSAYAQGSGWWFRSVNWNCADCFISNLNAPHDNLVWGELPNIRQVELKYRN